jgi:IS1 family transposase
MNRLSTERRTQIIHALVEGASVNATARQTGTSKVTILKMLAEVGQASLDYQRRMFVKLPCRRLQCDEIWSFIQCKEARVPRDEKGRGRGDCWIWVATCADTKLVPCWHIGARDAEAARLFMEDLASRLAARVQLTTDQFRAYLTAVEGAFGWNGVDYAMLVKLYGPPLENDHRYSPPRVVSAHAEWVMGKPEAAAISTSFVERQNLTLRMNVKRLARLTNAHSKKLENHGHALALHYMYYNFCRKHETLTKAKGGVHTTPAMAAGVADHVWKVSEIVGLLAAREATA